MASPKNQGLTTMNEASQGLAAAWRLRDIGGTHMFMLQCSRHNRHTQTIGGAIS